MQILSDGETILHVGERDCSVQRRYQKGIEEVPAPCRPAKLRDGLLEAALRFARHIGYKSLGTVEFLVDVDRGEFYFLEMKARIQVEHPVTEAISGLDLVAAQIAIAEGRPLGLTQNDITLNGHSFECRINAEDITADFRPSPGRVGNVWFPSATGLRVDTHIQSGAMISPHYDSMIAKVITWGETRDIALQRMRDTVAALNVMIGERYKTLPNEVIRYVLGRFGALTMPLNADLEDRVRSSKRAKALEEEPHMASFDELRAKLGKHLSDEEFLLRAVMPADQVDAMIAAGPAQRTYDPTHRSVKTLIKKLAARKDLHSVRIEKAGFKLEITGPGA